jgi:hypothetical protein
MHNSPLLEDLQALAKCDNCLEIKIKEDLDLSGAFIRILGENRNLLIEIKDPSYLTNVCIYTGKPMFVELHTPHGVSVQYAVGSGRDFYPSSNN